ncbi:hypothetical protein [Rhodopseudomonas palustris]|nr:hypothetical protein [Rhodopseudomonas palustris]OPF96107.1 hypothetical protein B1S06_04360 [Rhodopseudomonas palustris]RJF66692.1 hypothetical protein D4Q71_05245 [Rhodopseudomonas palustris]WND51329.1 hypothetical protein L1A21_23425 [Rhodopseudomonas palustris]
MKRKNSRSAYFVQRIPADVKGRVVGRRLAIPFGGRTKFFIATERSQAISFSLGTDDPVQVKILQAAIAGHLETVWQALRNDAPITLSHRQATALAGDLYRIWADSEVGARQSSSQSWCTMMQAE